MSVLTLHEHELKETVDPGQYEKETEFSAD